MAFPKNKKEGPSPAAASRAPMLTEAQAVAKKVSRLQAATAALAAVCVASLGAAAWSQADAAGRIDAAFAGTEQVVVLSQGLSAGEPIEESDLAIANVPAQLVAEGTLTPADLENPKTSPVGRLAASFAAKGSQVTSATAAGEGNPASLADSIAAGYEAVTVPVDSASGMAGMLREGDTVRVLVSADDEVGGTGVKIVSDGARIAAIGADFSAGASGDYSTVTLELTPEQAEIVRGADSAVTLTLPSSATAAGAL